MDPATVEGLLKAIRDAVSVKQRGEDVVLPPFDPAKNDNGVDNWCTTIESIAKDLEWSSITTVAKAGKALKGSALLWYETWDPEEGRSWENFKTTIKDLYPEKRNLTEKLTKAVLLNSESFDSYCEYAREKLRLLKNSKVSFTEQQLVELICGGIHDINVKMASHNSRVKTTAELISLFTTYVKISRKRPLDTDSKSTDKRDGELPSKQLKSNEPLEKRCHYCKQSGHVKTNCYKLKNQEARSNFKTAVATDGPGFSTNPIQCTYCKKIGHAESVCFFKKRADSKSTVKDKDNNINCLAKVNLKLTEVNIKGKTIKALIDTGASCSVIKDSIARQLGCNFVPYSSVLEGIGNGKLYIFAQVTAPVKFDDICLEIEFYVARDGDFYYDCLIGRNAIQYPDIAVILDSSGCRLTRTCLPLSKCVINHVSNSLDDEMVQLNESISHLDYNLQMKIKNVFEKFPSVLPLQNHIGTVKTGEMHLRLKKDEIIYYRPYRLAPVEREKVKEMIDDLLKKNIIRESDSPYASPVLLVKKKDGSDRMCIDFRALNKIIEKERYPLPLIEDQIDKLGTAKYYISIDMKNGFHQIPVAQNSIKYTAFITPDGHYEFLKMPFGICNGPSVFQRAICKAVQHLKFLLVYIDDLLIPFKTEEVGLQYLEQTLQALSSAGFTVNLKKCKFFVKEIEYLGRQISEEGVRPSNNKVSALTNSPIPTTVREVRQFMGLASYFRRFIPEFASRTSAITKLTKNNQKWEWGQEQDEARNYVITHLITKPLLTIFDPNLKTELHTDASSLGYGAILMQKVDGQSKVVAYFSKRTSPAESRYCSYDLETLAIYNALQHFRVYLLGIHFIIVTDCNAIKPTMNKRDLSPRVARWWTFMQDFQFEIVYKKGKFVGHVDYLSRNPNRLMAIAPLVVNIINDENNPPSWLEVAQRNDNETQSLIHKVQIGEIDSNQYIIINNLLHYKTCPDATSKLYIPRGYRLSLLRLYHDDNCHVGYEKTLNKIRENFWFPSMAAFTKKYITHCLICTSRKSHSGPKQGLLHPIQKSIPFHTLHLDCTGPFRLSIEGFKYILLIIDGFTKFCILRPLKSLNGQELVFVLRENLTLFGTPSLVITDRGTNFTSNQVQSLFQEMRVEHHMIATGTPRSNGQVERYVATVTNMLSTTVSDLPEWPNVLWKVQQSLNTTFQKSTGFSPIRLLIGREGNLPSIQAQLADVVDASTQPIINIQADRELAQQRLTAVANKYKERFDTTRRTNKTYNLGDMVYISQEHRRHEKLGPKFKGPYEIIEILPNDRFSLRGHGNLRNIIVAKEKIRFWPGEWIEQNASFEESL